ncbi:MAG TPA: fibronectin type III domain-containing protein [Acidimicrobiales bacterium]
MRKLSLREWFAGAVMLSAAAGVVIGPSGANSSAAPNPTWTLVPAFASSQSWSSVAYLNAQWIALGHQGDLATSVNGATWSEVATPSGTWQTIAYGNGRYVALSSADAAPNEMISSNAQQWTEEVGPPGSPQQAGRDQQNGQWTSLTYAHGLFVAVGSDGIIDSSPNGVTWTRRFWRPSDDFTSVTYGDGKFIAVDANQGNVLLSLNGTSWSDIFQPLTGVVSAPTGGVHYGAVAYGNGNFVALGDSASGAGYVATSVFGYRWTLRKYSPGEEIGAATFGCNSFLAAGSIGGDGIITSPTGQTWTPTGAGAADSAWTSIAYGAGQFMAVDTAGDIASLPASRCAQNAPSPPIQISGSVHSGQVSTYMHPPPRPGGAPVEGYRVAITDGAITRYCHAPVNYQPHCVTRGLTDHQVYWVTAQAYNRYGYSAPSDPEFVVPVADPSLAVAAHPDTTDAVPSDLELTGIAANSSGFYPVTKVLVHVGTSVVTCSPSPFGECLIRVADPPAGTVPVYSSYVGWFGRVYRSPTYHFSIPAT